MNQRRLAVVLAELHLKTQTTRRFDDGLDRDIQNSVVQTDLDAVADFVLRMVVLSWHSRNVPKIIRAATCDQRRDPATGLLCLLFPNGESHVPPYVALFPIGKEPITFAPSDFDLSSNRQGFQAMIAVCLLLAPHAVSRVLAHSVNFDVVLPDRVCVTRTPDHES